MKKGIRFSLWILGIGIVFSTAGWGLVCILKYFGLMFRAWVGIVFFVIMALLGIALIGGIVYTLVKVYSRPQEEKRKRTIQKLLAAGGIVVVLSGTGMSGILVLFWTALGYNPEHVVEKYGQKMVAYNKSFLDLNVEYHEYKNFLVNGIKIIGNEGPENNFWFYDFQGNLIASFEEEFTPQELPENIAVSFPPEEMKCIFNSSETRAWSEMLYSIDGKNWEERSTGYHYQFFFDDIGYLIFSYDLAMLQHEAAAIYKSTDGGENWAFISDTPSDKLLQNTVFFDENTGIFEYGVVGTDSYVLYVTTDGASTIAKVDLPTELQGKTDDIKGYLFK